MGSSRVLAVLVALAVPWAGCGGKSVDETGSRNDGPGGDDGADAGQSGAANGSGGGGSRGGTTASGGSTGGGGIQDAWFQCTDTSECALTSADCCAPCQYASAADARAVRHDRLDALTSAICAGRGPVACPPTDCDVRPQFVIPLCIEGRCTALDIRNDKLTSCSTSAECRLRQGTACCLPCSIDPGMVVAVNAQVDYDATVCGTGSGCPECVGAPIPGDAHAVCESNHCCVRFELQ